MEAFLWWRFLRVARARKTANSLSEKPLLKSLLRRGLGMRVNPFGDSRWVQPICAPTVAFWADYPRPWGPWGFHPG